MNPIVWRKDRLELLDQRLLPARVEYITCTDAVQVAEAIREMAVRGAPAIGVAAAFGLALAARQNCRPEALRRQADILLASRPTAVNLAWAVERMLAAAGEECSYRRLAEEAESIFSEDIEINRSIGRHGARLVKDGDVILTHCNAGALATAGYGTALGVIRRATEAGKKVEVFADETRPYLQGARLTAWELQQQGIPVTLLVDSAAAGLLAAGRIDLVIVGADRISADGDVINKVGTYGVALAARAAGVPFYVAAPLSTVDISTPTGCDVIIEERDPREVTHWRGEEVAPAGVKVFNPAFDRTPAELITGIITQRGVVYRPNRCKIISLLEKE